MENQRQVQSAIAKQFAKENNLLFLETSAKNGNNVEKIFQILSEQILTKIDAGLINPDNELGIKKGNETTHLKTPDSSKKNSIKLKLKMKYQKDKGKSVVETEFN